MLYYNFYGYERFKACFGLEKRDDGTVVRKEQDTAEPSEESCIAQVLQGA